MSAQAQSMNEAVQELVALVGGTSDAGRAGATGIRRESNQDAPAYGLQATDKTFHQIAGPTPDCNKGLASQTAAQQQIPLHDDEGMADFNS